MSSADFENLQREISQIIHSLFRNGLSAAVSPDYAHALFAAALELQKSFVSPDRERVLFQACLIWHASFAAAEPPLWRNIATLGANGDGSKWSVPTSPEAKRLYALLLTNCAIARCIWGEEFQGTISHVANEALELFSELRDSQDNHWISTLYVVLAHYAHASGYAEYSVGYAQKALGIMGPSPTNSADLQLYAKFLASEVQEALIYEGGFLGFGRRSRQAFFGVQDLFLFNRK